MAKVGQTLYLLDGIMESLSLPANLIQDSDIPVYGNGYSSIRISTYPDKAVAILSYASGYADNYPNVVPLFYAADLNSFVSAILLHPGL